MHLCWQTEEVAEVHEELALALALARGLQLDTQRSSRDSLQCSSGYSTQTTTPCCSEDTIPSQSTALPILPFYHLPWLSMCQRVGRAVFALVVFPYRE